LLVAWAMLFDEAPRAMASLIALVPQRRVIASRSRSACCVAGLVILARSWTALWSSSKIFLPLLPVGAVPAGFHQPGVIAVVRLVIVLLRFCAADPDNGSYWSCAIRLMMNCLSAVAVKWLSVAEPVLPALSIAVALI